MRILGPHRDRPLVELDPEHAYRRGRILDAMLRSAHPGPPRGVFRGTFEFFAAQDLRRMVEAARRFNGG